MGHRKNLSVENKGAEIDTVRRCDIPQRKLGLSVLPDKHPTNSELFKVQVQNEFNTQYRWMTAEQVGRLFDLSFDEAMQWGDKVEHFSRAGKSSSM